MARIDFTEYAEHDWRDMLDDFKDRVYPMFQNYNITFESALLYWMMNNLYNKVDELVEIMEGAEIERGDDGDSVG